MKISIIAALTCAALLIPGSQAVAKSAVRISEATLSGADQERLGAILTFLKSFYASRGDQPAWTDPVNVALALDILARTVEDGLDPEDFNYSRLLLLSQAGHSKELDIELTASMVLLGYVLHQGKVDPEFRRIDSFWQRVTSSNPIIELNYVLETGLLREAMDNARPKLMYYRDLKSALATHRQIVADGGWPTVSEGATLRLGDEDPRVIEIAERLAAGGFLNSRDAGSLMFGQTLEAAVKEFQLVHGEDADGIVGKRTVEAMNVSAAARVDQIRVNMERARWVGDLPEGRHILVNIAGFYAAVMENAQPIWTTRVIVGKDFTQTPVFVDEIEYLEFNPTWTAPRSIIKGELAAKIIADPGYLNANDYYLAAANGREIDPRSVNWAVLTPQNFPYWVVQRPGEKNALGRVKFMFPNEHSVYMHDTPNRGLFDRALRTFSHGCIRTENPLDLAELLLRGQGWTSAKIQDVLASGRRTPVTLDRRVPVALLYWTVDPTERGVRFHRDIYDRDSAVLRALDAPFP